MCNIGELIDLITEDYNSLLSYTNVNTKVETLNSMKENTELLERRIRRWLIELKKD